MKKVVFISLSIVLLLGVITVSVPLKSQATETLPEPYAKIDFSTGAAIDLKGKVELTNNGASFSEKEFK
ncbi:MAG: hypothetical protein WC143_07205, partial [Eubacteriales bacterium]